MKASRALSLYLDAKLKPSAMSGNIETWAIVIRVDMTVPGAIGKFQAEIGINSSSSASASMTTPIRQLILRERPAKTHHSFSMLIFDLLRSLWFPLSFGRSFEEVLSGSFGWLDGEPDVDTREASSSVSVSVLACLLVSSVVQDFEPAGAERSAVSL